MSSIGYRLLLERDVNQFYVTVDYSIDPYYDPESSEVFSDTSWYAYDGLGTTSGYGSASESITIFAGLSAGEEVKNRTFSFTASNTFSADTTSVQFNIFDAAFATGDKTVVATAGEDAIITGSGDDTLRGFAGNDWMDAGPGSDILDGGDGDDTLNGGTGADIMIGGRGTDFYYVDDVDDVVIERAGQGGGAIISSVSYTLPANVTSLNLVGQAIEGTGGRADDRIDGNDMANRLSGLGGNDQLYGYGGNDTLVGSAGDDLLDGGVGDDRMEGGAGNDTYVVDSSTDRIVERGNDGIDEVRLFGPLTYSLGANIENLTVLYAPGDVTASGNALANRMIGFGGKDDFSGGANADSLFGMGGDDSLAGGSGDDQIDGGADNDILIGGAGLDTLTGGAGNDRLTGGDGRDALYGGTGADTFVYTGLDDSAPGAAVRDVIYDFSHAEGDRIDLSRIDANRLAGGNQAFLFRGTAAFDGRPGEVRVTYGDDYAVVTADVDGDRNADFGLLVQHVTSAAPLVATDFLL